MNITELKKGDRIRITNDSIYKMMGFTEVTGTVFFMNEHSMSIQCDQTGALELYTDGKIERL